MPDVSNFTYKLDGRLVATNDAILSGRKIRVGGGLNPASDYILIEVADAASRSVGLDETIDLRKDQPPEFLSFKSDRTFSLTVNERGFEWGAEDISAEDIRRYAAIPDDHELVLDSDRDRPIDDTDIIRLNRKGVERLLSRELGKVRIVVNTIDEFVKPGQISFEELAKLAFPDSQVTANTAYTVSYRKGPRNHPEGSLIAGESVKVKEGMIFDVSETDKS